MCKEVLNIKLYNNDNRMLFILVKAMLCNFYLRDGHQKKLYCRNVAMLF